MNTKLLEKFYAVTVTPGSTKSVYEAKIGGDGEKPVLTKIALDGQSKIQVGGQIRNGAMIGITDRLQLFVPEGSGMVSPMSTIERDIVLVSTCYHGGCTSDIVALFLGEAKALACFNEKDHKRCDQRWVNDSIETLRAIGMEHPYCSISTADPRWWLMPPSFWQDANDHARKNEGLLK
ncbi:MAG: hypothetical protein KGI45_00570 [Patescibacteria group bacterium]|nr:hypothetical protein [Patescibacteria group bacterium]MDE1941291.1 hypothetical protein [Patescibacteria group bacterium]MDE1966558.1 hypothetical protein [Patescibacteria group bacterium]